MIFAKKVSVKWVDLMLVRLYLNIQRLIKKRDQWLFSPLTAFMSPCDYLFICTNNSHWTKALCGQGKFDMAHHCFNR